MELDEFVLDWLFLRGRGGQEPTFLKVLIPEETVLPTPEITTNWDSVVPPDPTSLYVNAFAALVVWIIGLVVLAKMRKARRHTVMETPQTPQALPWTNPSPQTEASPQPEEIKEHVEIAGAWQRTQEDLPPSDCVQQLALDENPVPHKEGSGLSNQDWLSPDEGDQSLSLAIKKAVVDVVCVKDVPDVVDEAQKVNQKDELTDSSICIDTFDDVLCLKMNSEVYKSRLQHGDVTPPRRKREISKISRRKKRKQAKHQGMPATDSCSSDNVKRPKRRSHITDFEDLCKKYGIDKENCYISSDYSLHQLQLPQSESRNRHGALKEKRRHDTNLRMDPPTKLTVRAKSSPSEVTSSAQSDECSWGTANDNQATSSSSDTSPCSLTSSSTNNQNDDTTNTFNSNKDANLENRVDEHNVPESTCEMERKEEGKTTPHGKERLVASDKIVVLDRKDQMRQERLLKRIGYIPKHDNALVKSVTQKTPATILANDFDITDPRYFSAEVQRKERDRMETIGHSCHQLLTNKKFSKASAGTVEGKRSCQLLKRGHSAVDMTKSPRLDHKQNMPRETNKYKNPSSTTQNKTFSGLVKRQSVNEHYPKSRFKEFELSTSNVVAQQKQECKNAQRTVSRGSMQSQTPEKITKTCNSPKRWPILRLKKGVLKTTKPLTGMNSPKEPHLNMRQLIQDTRKKYQRGFLTRCVFQRKVSDASPVTTPIQVSLSAEVQGQSTVTVAEEEKFVQAAQSSGRSLEIKQGESFHTHASGDSGMSRNESLIESDNSISIAESNATSGKSKQTLSGQDGEKHSDPSSSDNVDSVSENTSRTPIPSDGDPLLSGGAESSSEKKSKTPKSQESETDLCSSKEKPSSTPTNAPSNNEVVAADGTINQLTSTRLDNEQNVGDKTLGDNGKFGVRILSNTYDDKQNVVATATQARRSHIELIKIKPAPQTESSYEYIHRHRRVPTPTNPKGKRLANIARNATESECKNSTYFSSSKACREQAIDVAEATTKQNTPKALNKQFDTDISDVERATHPPSPCSDIRSKIAAPEQQRRGYRSIHCSSHSDSHSKRSNSFQDFTRLAQQSSPVPRCASSNSLPMVLANTASSSADFDLLTLLGKNTTRPSNLSKTKRKALLKRFKLKTTATGFSTASRNVMKSDSNESNNPQNAFLSHLNAGIKLSVTQPSRGDPVNKTLNSHLCQPSYSNTQERDTLDIRVNHENIAVGETENDIHGNRMEDHKVVPDRETIDNFNEDTLKISTLFGVPPKQIKDCRQEARKGSRHCRPVPGSLKNNQKSELKLATPIGKSKVAKQCHELSRPAMADRTKSISNGKGLTLAVAEGKVSPTSGSYRKLHQRKRMTVGVKPDSKTTLASLKISSISRIDSKAAITSQPTSENDKMALPNKLDIHCSDSQKKLARQFRKPQPHARGSHVREQSHNRNSNIDVGIDAKNAVFDYREGLHKHDIATEGPISPNDLHMADEGLEDITRNAQTSGSSRKIKNSKSSAISKVSYILSNLAHLEDLEPKEVERLSLPQQLPDLVVSSADSNRSYVPQSGNKEFVVDEFDDGNNQTGNSTYTQHSRFTHSCIYDTTSDISSEKSFLSTFQPPRLSNGNASSSPCVNGNQEGKACQFEMPTNRLFPAETHSIRDRREGQRQATSTRHDPKKADSDNDKDQSDTWRLCKPDLSTLDCNYDQSGKPLKFGFPQKPINRDATILHQKHSSHENSNEVPDTEKITTTLKTPNVHAIYSDGQNAQVNLLKSSKKYQLATESVVPFTDCSQQGKTMSSIDHDLSKRRTLNDRKQRKPTGPDQKSFQPTESKNVVEYKNGPKRNKTNLNVRSKTKDALAGRGDNVQENSFAEQDYLIPAINKRSSFNDISSRHLTNKISNPKDDLLTCSSSDIRVSWLTDDENKATPGTTRQIMPHHKGKSKRGGRVHSNTRCPQTSASKQTTAMDKTCNQSACDDVRENIFLKMARIGKHRNKGVSIEKAENYSSKQHKLGENTARAFQFGLTKYVDSALFYDKKKEMFSPQVVNEVHARNLETGETTCHVEPPCASQDLLTDDQAISSLKQTRFTGGISQEMKNNNKIPISFTSIHTTHIDHVNNYDTLTTDSITSMMTCDSRTYNCKESNEDNTSNDVSSRELRSSQVEIKNEAIKSNMSNSDDLVSTSEAIQSSLPETDGVVIQHHEEFQSTSTESAQIAMHLSDCTSSSLSGYEDISQPLHSSVSSVSSEQCSNQGRFKTFVLDWYRPSSQAESSTFRTESESSSAARIYSDEDQPRFDESTRRGDPVSILRGEGFSHGFSPAATCSTTPEENCSFEKQLNVQSSPNAKGASLYRLYDSGSQQTGSVLDHQSSRYHPHRRLNRTMSNRRSLSEMRARMDDDIEPGHVESYCHCLVGSSVTSTGLGHDDQQMSAESRHCDVVEGLHEFTSGSETIDDNISTTCHPSTSWQAVGRKWDTTPRQQRIFKGFQEDTEGEVLKRKHSCAENGWSHSEQLTEMYPFSNFENDAGKTKRARVKVTHHDEKTLSTLNKISIDKNKFCTCPKYVACSEDTESGVYCKSQENTCTTSSALGSWREQRLPHRAYGRHRTYGPSPSYRPYTCNEPSAPCQYPFYRSHPFYQPNQSQKCRVGSRRRRFGYHRL